MTLTVGFTRLLDTIKPEKDNLRSANPRSMTEAVFPNITERARYHKIVTLICSNQHRPSEKSTLRYSVCEKAEDVDRISVDLFTRTIAAEITQT